MQLTYKAKSLRMSFCLDCHREPERYLRPDDQVWNMAWEPPPDQMQRGAELGRRHGIEAKHLDNCSLCHR
jgi:hypothetical protein